MRKVTVIAFGSALILAGCAPPHMYQWTKSGATYDDYLKDRYTCIRDGRTTVSSGFISNGVGAMDSGQVISAQIAVPCMAAHGWRDTPGGFVPPPGGAVVMH
jgi:hypothetical protein